jgi:pyruvate dehydrogenase E1 component beta subunit
MVIEYPSMAPLFIIECVFEQASKLRAMTGGQAAMPIVFVSDGSSRKGGSAQQHTDVGQEAIFAFMPGITVVCPTNSYDAKGLMASAIHLGGPVVFMNYGEAGSSAPVEVPDAVYEVPIGKAAIRREGKALTLVAWAPATIDCEVAVPDIVKAGIDVEYIDLRTLKPLDNDTLFASVKKTGRLLVVEHGPYTNSFSSHVLAEVAQFVPGAKVRKITFPDAPGPNPTEMIMWMRPDAPKIIDAAKNMMKL